MYDFLPNISSVYKLRPKSFRIEDRRRQRRDYSGGTDLESVFVRTLPLRRDEMCRTYAGWPNDP